MRLKMKTLAGGLVIGLGLATTAPAATLDFLGMANNQEQAVEYSPTINPIMNVYVPIATTAIGYTGNSGDALAALTDAGAWAYLDGNSAGMGVCSTGISSTRQCTTPSDDNIQMGEVLGLSWATSMMIESLSFRGEAHPNDPEFAQGESFDVSFDSGVTWSTFGLLNAKFGNSVFVNGIVKAGDSLLLTTSARGNNRQFYLSAAEVSAVPLPAAGLLLLGALGGLGLVRRRKRAA